jgi:mannosyltransferase
METHSSIERHSTLILTGLIIFVIALALLVFSHQSLRLDESQSLWQTSHTPTKILNIIAQDVHVPLYHFILHFWQLFLGNSVLTGRILSLIFFVMSIPAVYFLGKRVLNRGIGIFAATLLAASPFMNWYGNEIRMYSLMTLLTILSQYFFIMIYKYRNRDAWVGYFIVNVFGIFTHYFFFFVLIVQVIFYFLYRDQFPPRTLRRFIIIGLILLILFSPWLWYVRSLGSASNETPLLAPPTSVNVFNTFSQFIFGFQNDHLNTILVSLWPLTVLLGFLALRENKKVSPETIYILLSILVPIAAAFVVSVTYKPLFVSRYLILTIPSLYIFIGWIFSTYPEALRKLLTAILIFSMLAALAVEAYSPTAPVKEDYRDATQYLNQNAAPQDIIILSAPFTVYPVEYYYRGPSEIETLPMWNRFVTGPIPGFDENTLPDQVNTLKGTHEKAYVLLSYDQGYEEKIRLYMDTHFERTDHKQFSPGLDLYVYRLRYDPHVLNSDSSESTTTASTTRQ